MIKYLSYIFSHGLLSFFILHQEKLTFNIYPQRQFVIINTSTMSPMSDMIDIFHHIKSSIKTKIIIGTKGTAAKDIWFSAKPSSIFKVRNCRWLTGIAPYVCHLWLMTISHIPLSDIMNWQHKNIKMIGFKGIFITRWPYHKVCFAFILRQNFL